MSVLGHFCISVSVYVALLSACLLLFGLQLTVFHSAQARLLSDDENSVTKTQFTGSPSGRFVLAVLLCAT